MVTFFSAPIPTANISKGGGTREYDGHFKRFKEGIKETQLFLEHQRTNQIAHQGF